MMAMKVKEVANLVGISVRTLHHYDDIELLKPNDTSDSGYRLYSDDDLETLQQILFFKELGFPLKKIKQILNSPTFDRLEALELQQRLLLKKRNSLDQMLATIDRTTQHMRGEIEMSNKEKFEGFDFSNNPYEEEARERWGDQTVDKSNAKLGNLSKRKQQAITEQMNDIYRRLADLRDCSPESDEVQAAIKEWYDFLNDNFGNHYSLDAFRGLGQMYVDDERFTKNIDLFGEGLAKFMCKSMGVYADNNKE